AGRGLAASGGTAVFAAERAAASGEGGCGAGEGALPGDGRGPRLLARLDAGRGVAAGACSSVVVAGAAGAVRARATLALLGHLRARGELERAGALRAGPRARGARPVPPLSAPELRRRRRRSADLAAHLRRLDDRARLLAAQRPLPLRPDPNGEPRTRRAVGL
ncbi:MAG: Alkylpyrone O-methyltransferase (B. subtilis BpsB), partial [uncultured Rubrobacteraceae bacterium]